MAKLTEKQKILTFAGGGLFLCLVAGGGIYWAKGLVDEERQAITADEEKTRVAKTKIDKIPRLEREVIVLRENVGTYTKILPEASEVNDFFRAVNRYVSQHGVTLTLMKKVEEGKRGKYSQYSYRIDIRATLWQFMRFLNAFENHERFLRISDFQIDPADKRDAERALAQGEDVVHKIVMTVETFVYNGGQGAGDVKIPGYAQKLEQVREEVAQGSHALQLERYDYVENRARRDLFVDPRPRIGGPNLNDNPRALQARRVEEFAKRVADLGGYAARLEDPELSYVERQAVLARIKAELDVLVPDIEQVSPLITNPMALSEWQGNVVTPVRHIAALVGVEQAADPGGFSVEDIQALRTAMLEDVERGDYDAALDRFEDAIDRLAIADEQDPRFEEAQAVVKLKMIIELAVEFADIPLEVKGVVVFDQGRSGILINNRVYEEGEYLDENLLLKAVGVEHADFVYKGYTLRKKW